MTVGIVIELRTSRPGLLRTLCLYHTILLALPLDSCKWIYVNTNYVRNFYYRNVKLKHSRHLCANILIII